jgi:hypothetical protein
MGWLGIDNITWFLLYSVSGAFIGALVTPVVFGLIKHRKPATGFFAGVFVGAVGNLIWLVPLWLLVRPRSRTASDLFDLAVAYNLGVASALGGRREEARYYFVQVTQADDRNIGAWLYLANLATTPLESWSFLQEAQLIAPDHPAVQQAVQIVWPQVRDLVGVSHDPLTPIKTESQP